MEDALVCGRLSWHRSRPYDFLVVGFGDSYEEAARDHDENLLAFLKSFEEQDIHLNPEKMKLMEDEVSPFYWTLGISARTRS